MKSLHNFPDIAKLNADWAAIKINEVRKNLRAIDHRLTEVVND